MAVNEETNRTITLDLGPVSAYAIAVAEGFKGSRAEWESYIAGVGVNAEKAHEYALASEGYANGKQDGVDVTDPLSPYHGNNAHYWAGKAAENGDHYAEQAKEWADGEDKSGDPVASTEPQYQNSAKYWAGQAANTAGMLGDVALDSTAQIFVRLVDDNSILTEEMFDLMIEMLPGDDSGQLILQDLVDENSNLDLLVRELLEREATA